jgi:predicted SPOUT superfamily RNA methylase MTH1
LTAKLYNFHHFTDSSFSYFYYDGYIFKVIEKETYLIGVGVSKIKKLEKEIANIERLPGT